MDTLLQAHAAPLRQALLGRLQVLEAEVRDAELAGRGDPGDRETRDVGDVAAQTADATVAGADKERDLAELDQIRSALRRLETGTYGNCIDCDEPIALERLRVHPAADRCTACQTTFEHRRSA